VAVFAALLLLPVAAVLPRGYGRYIPLVDAAQGYANHTALQLEQLVIATSTVLNTTVLGTTLASSTIDWITPPDLRRRVVVAPARPLPRAGPPCHRQLRGVSVIRTRAAPREPT
jgi:hypothetical protein